MNKDIFEAILTGKIDGKNYHKSKISKTMFYNHHKRVEFYKKIVEPVEFLILNCSEKEFRAVQTSKLKTEIPSKKRKGSFSMGRSKLSKQVDKAR